MRETRGWMLLVTSSILACTPVFSPGELGEPSNPREEARLLAEAYGRIAQRIAALPEGLRTRERASRHGIEVVDVLREVAARARPGAPEPRVPGVALEVNIPADGRGVGAVLAPAFRSPSSSPLEVRVDRFFLRVGNHHGEPRRTVSLSHFLADVGRYVTSPASLTGAASVGERVSFAAPGDHSVIVDVQAVVVPVPVGGRAAVHPVLWSPTSSPRAPAALVVVASRDGTSARVIENRPEDRSTLGSGQILDFNDGGERRPFAVGTRLPEVIAVIEVPLATARVDVHGGGSGPAREPARDEAGPPIEDARVAASRARGPFVEGSGDRIERDEARPLRATVLLLYPIIDGELDDDDWQALASRLRTVARSPEAAGTRLLPDGDARR